MQWKHAFSLNFHGNLRISMKIYGKSYFLREICGEHIDFHWNFMQILKFIWKSIENRIFSRKYVVKACIFIDISWKSWNFNEMHWKCIVFIDFPGKNMVLHTFLSVSRFARKKGRQNTVVRQKPWNGPARRAWPEAPQAPEATYIESEIFKKNNIFSYDFFHKNYQKLYFGAHRI